MTIIELINTNKLVLDVEFGNADSFYSGFKTNSLPHKNSLPLKKKDIDSNWCWKGDLIRTNLNLKDSWLFNSKEKLNRKLSFYATEDSYLYDMVSRFVVKSTTSNSATIADQKYPHLSKNLYYQYQANTSVRVPISTSQYIEFSSESSLIPKGFKEVFYIRDETKDGEYYNWIVHHRLIVDPNECNLILRGCNPRIEGVLPLQNFIPKIIKKIFFRIREIKYPNFPIMTVGETCLPKNKSAQLATKVTLNDY